MEWLIAEVFLRRSRFKTYGDVFRNLQGLTPSIKGETM